ncbi:MAG: hypothetical protein IJP90_12100 [Treponema sp.]|nr:hypothetical protein [Treponema sp.]
MAENEKTTKEKFFDEINALYAEYVSLQGQTNVESKRLAVREKIQIALYKVYVTIPKSAEEGEDKSEDVNYNSYADVIFKISADCLESFGKSDSNEKMSFSQYACSSIKRRLNFLKQKDSAEQKNGGMKIPEDAFKKAKKIKALDEQYKKFGFKDEKKRNIKIADSLETTIEKVVELKALWERKTVSQIQTNDESEEFDVIDKKQEKNGVEEIHNGYFMRPAKVFELNSQLESLLEAIKSELEEKFNESLEERTYFTKALTVDLCRKHFPQRLAPKKDGKDGLFLEARKITNEDSEYIVNLEKLFRKASILDSAILNKLFTDENYKLPEMQALEKEADHAKSYFSKKLGRFYDDVIERFEKAGFNEESDKDFAKRFLIR